MRQGEDGRRKAEGGKFPHASWATADNCADHQWLLRFVTLHHNVRQDDEPRITARCRSYRYGRATASLWQLLLPNTTTPNAYLIERGAVRDRSCRTTLQSPNTTGSLETHALCLRQTSLSLTSTGIKMALTPTTSASSSASSVPSH